MRSNLMPRGILSPFGCEYTNVRCITLVAIMPYHDPRRSRNRFERRRRLETIRMELRDLFGTHVELVAVEASTMLYYKTHVYE